MRLFQKTDPSLSPRRALLNKYNTCRINLLFVVIFTLVNVIFAALGTPNYFLFSAALPYCLVSFAALVCGKMPPEYYDDWMTEADFLDTSFLVVMIVIALVIIAVYGLLFFLSRKQKSAWLIVALVFFALDTVFMFYWWGLSLDMILDLLFHAWVIYYLVAGIISARKLKSLPPDEEEEALEIDDTSLVPESVSIGNGKTKTAIAANYFRGTEAVGGKLYFYGDRVVFRSHDLNIQTGDTSILYADMVKTEGRKNLGISNGLSVFTSDGFEHKFVIWHRDDVMAFLDGKIQEAKHI